MYTGPNYSNLIFILVSGQVRSPRYTHEMCDYTTKLCGILFLLTGPVRNYYLHSKITKNTAGIVTLSEYSGCLLSNQAFIGVRNRC